MSRTLSTSTWIDWLAASAYGFNWRAEVDPPCTLAELAAAYVKRDGSDDGADSYMWAIEAETGEWRGLE